MKKIGFIGMGNMAQAIAGGILDRGLMKPEEILAYAPNQDKLQRNAEVIGFTPISTIEELVEKAEMLLIACKPYQIAEMLANVMQNPVYESALKQDKSILSIALGWDYAAYAKILGKAAKIQFIMPNTPAQVGEGVFLFEETNTLPSEDLKQVKEIFAMLGKVEVLPTHLMGIGGAITGCGPAFVDLMLEGFADAAVKYGIPRTMAYELVSQTVLGTAKLQLETGTHPGVLKDAVCSPAGSTIRGVDALEHAGFRAACIDAIDAVMNR